MAVYKPELVKKILRLAESDHDGEAAAAMRKLTAMAKEQGQNLDEMMAHVYGNGASSTSSSPFSSSRPSGRYRDPFEEMFRQARRAQEQAAEARRKREAEANEAKKRAERPTPRWYHEPDPPPEPPPWDDVAGSPYAEQCLQDLHDAYQRWGVAPLSVWEVNFVTDILSRGKNYSTSPAQDAVIDRIVAKYAGWQHRNGSAEGFWKA